MPIDLIVGAVLFWLPDAIVHIVAPRYAPLIGLVFFSWFLPLITLAGLEALFR